jgi:hypothetical protein
MKSSFQRLIPFLPVFRNCQFWRLDSIKFLCSQAHILTGWRLETRRSILNWTLLYNHFARTTQQTRPLYCWEGVFTAPLHSNGSYSIVACVFVAAGMFLPSRCLAINFYSDFTIPDFERHVTIFNVTQFEDQAMCMIFCWGSILSPRSQRRREDNITAYFTEIS